MNQKKTLAIVLSRVDYGEADRIITVITPEQGKLSLMAKGVRRVRSKLAGGIELFSENELTYIPGRGEVGSLVSSRMVTHYAKLLSDIDRTMMGYDILKLFHKSTEHEVEQVYYATLKNALEGLQTDELSPKVLQLWFWARLLALGGHAPNLTTDKRGEKLQTGVSYAFDYDSMCLDAQNGGPFGERDIKFLRLLFARPNPIPLSGIDGAPKLVECGQPLISSLKSLYLQG